MPPQKLAANTTTPASKEMLGFLKSIFITEITPLSWKKRVFTFQEVETFFYSLFVSTEWNLSCNDCKRKKNEKLGNILSKELIKFRQLPVKIRMGPFSINSKKINKNWTVFFSFCFQKNGIKIRDWLLFLPLRDQVKRRRKKKCHSPRLNCVFFDLLWKF